VHLYCAQLLKNHYKWPISRKPEVETWRKHAQSIFFDPGYLFDFYNDRGSTAAPSGHSNVRWCGLGIFSGRNGVVKFSTFFSQIWSPMEQKLEKWEFWFLETLENTRRCIQINRKLSVRWRITPLVGAKHANFFKIGKFKRPSSPTERPRVTKFSDSLNRWAL